VVVAQREDAGDPLAAAAEVTADALAHRLERLEAGGAWRGVDADAVGRAVIDGDEDGDLALAGDSRGQVGAPHHVHRLRDDGAVVGARPARRAGSRPGEQAMHAHQPQRPTAGGGHATIPQPRPHLPVPLTMKGAGGEHDPDRRHEVGIRHRPHGARPPRRRGRRRGGAVGAAARRR